MKTHNQLIYHCERCGRITYQDPEEPRPACCNTPMTHAAATTVTVDDDFESPSETHLVDEMAPRPRKAR